MAHQVIAICSAEDAAVYRQLDVFLTSAKRAGLLVLHRTADFVDDVSLASAIDEADLLIALLTPALIHSSLWNGVALQQAQATVDARHIPIVPVVVQRCDWKRSWIGDRVALPRDGKPLAEQRGGMDAGWAEVVAELQGILRGRTPRIRDVTPAQGHEPRPGSSPTVTADVPPAREHEVGAQGALSPDDLSEVPHAYRRIEQYHAALLRLVDAASRTMQGMLGQLPNSSWNPGELYYPGRRPGPSAGAASGHIPLKHVSYVWASTRDLQTGGCQVILVHDGDGALNAQSGRDSPTAPRPTLSVFAAFVVHHREEPSYSSSWEDADTTIDAAPGFSHSNWQDGGVHVAETRNTTFRFGGFTEDMASILASPSPEPWVTRLRALVSGVRAG